jgi:hypothetical protein
MAKQPTAAADVPAQPIANPAAGGSYVVDPATGERTCVMPATAHVATRKVQDPVTGVITRVPVQE